MPRYFKHKSATVSITASSKIFSSSVGCGHMSFQTKAEIDSVISIHSESAHSHWLGPTQSHCRNLCTLPALPAALPILVWAELCRRLFRLPCGLCRLPSGLYLLASADCRLGSTGCRLSWFCRLQPEGGRALPTAAAVRARPAAVCARPTAAPACSNCSADCRIGCADWPTVVRALPAALPTAVWALPAALIAV